MYHPDPTYFARNGLSRGRKVEGQPPGTDFCCYGFDDKGRLVHASEKYTKLFFYMMERLFGLSHTTMTLLFMWDCWNTKGKN